MNFIGQLAALTTAWCWSFTAVFFTEAGRRIGSYRVNNIRLLFATVIYVIVLFFSTGHVWPEGVTSPQVLWLAASGLIGLVIGDGLGFRALVILGPRKTTMMWSTAPIMATIIAWFLLGEQLHITEIVGIVLTIAGVTWVVSEREYSSDKRPPLPVDHPDSGSTLTGVMLGLGAALGQATGLVMSKHAMMNLGSVVEPMPAAFIRMFSSMLIIWGLSLFRGQGKKLMESFRHGPAMLFAAGGAIFGPFLGVWMSLVAVKHIEAGIAATLNATTPILIIPVVIFYYREKITLRAVLGACVAFLGIALLFVGDGIFTIF